MITINEVDPADVCEDYTPTQCERCIHYERADWSVGISESCGQIDYDDDPHADTHEAMLFDDARNARCEFYQAQPTKQHTGNVYAQYADLYESDDEMITDATRILHNVGEA